MSFLPKQVTGTPAGTVTYTYDAGGNKLTKQTVSETRQYIGGIEFTGGTIDLLHTEAGIARNNSGTYTYELSLSDHLGNTRIVHNTAGTVLQQIDYYPFGLDIKRTQAIPNKYLYNGKEKQEELVQYDYGVRFYDPAIGRWHVVDALSEKTVDQSPYSYVFNNPIAFIDPDGNSGTSTHTDKYGKVIAVYDDGDLGVYKHDDVSKWDKKSTLSNLGDGVTKMGETEYWDEFAMHNATNDIVQTGKNGNFADPDAHINFGVSQDSYVQGLNNEYISTGKNNISTTAKNILQTKSGNGGDYDIKVKLGAREGYLYNGKYTSGESLGNRLFGMNVSALYDYNSFTIKLVYNKEGFFKDVMKVAGAYHNRQNKVNNEVLPPYYGEINYSGRSIVHGFFKSGATSYMNRFQNYGNGATYGYKKLKL
ncbi:MAG: RHS repeat-associated core domain-containing protein [Niabella sp.]|nr:RHS repeat-associated core domain-containing protein [Niabella sp.]